MGRKFNQAKYDAGVRLVRELGFTQIEAANLVGLHPQTLHNYISKSLANYQNKSCKEKTAKEARLPDYIMLPPSSIRPLTKEELMCGKANGYGTQKVSA